MCILCTYLPFIICLDDNIVTDANLSAAVALLLMNVFSTVLPQQCTKSLTMTAGSIRPCERSNVPGEVFHIPSGSFATSFVSSIGSGQTACCTVDGRHPPYRHGTGSCTASTQDASRDNDVTPQCWPGQSICASPSNSVLNFCSQSLCICSKARLPAGRHRFRQSQCRRSRPVHR